MNNSAFESSTIVLPLELSMISRVAGMVKQSFDRFVAPQYSPEGRDAFYRYSSPQMLKQRFLEREHRAWVAVQDHKIIGFAEIRIPRHLSMLFVHPECQGKGIAHLLWSTCISQTPADGRWTVNAAPNAIGLYKKLGFVESGKPISEHGLVYYPMERLPQK
jgi:ribosomal protein S18 acetylase RimI-like enzyme